MQPAFRVSLNRIIPQLLHTHSLTHSFNYHRHNTNLATDSVPKQSDYNYSLATEPAGLKPDPIWTMFVSSMYFCTIFESSLYFCTMFIIAEFLHSVSLLYFCTMFVSSLNFCTMFIIAVFLRHVCIIAVFLHPVCIFTVLLHHVCTIAIFLHRTSCYSNIIHYLSGLCIPNRSSEVSPSKFYKHHFTLCCVLILFCKIFHFLRRWVWAMFSYNRGEIPKHNTDRHLRKINGKNLKHKEVNFLANNSRTCFCCHPSFIQPTFQQIAYKLI